MATITFITKTGETIELSAEQGTVMELAVDHKVKGIDGDCGGVCSCTTCHVHVPDEFIEQVGRADELEAYLLELDENYSENSRLSCQVEITEKLNGVVLKVANE